MEVPENTMIIAVDRAHDLRLTALERGVIAGAALDVFENEPHVPARLNTFQARSRAPPSPSAGDVASPRKKDYSLAGNGSEQTVSLSKEGKNTALGLAQPGVVRVVHPGVQLCLRSHCIFQGCW